MTTTPAAPEGQATPTWTAAIVYARSIKDGLQTVEEFIAARDGYIAGANATPKPPAEAPEVVISDDVIKGALLPWLGYLPQKLSLYYHYHEKMRGILTGALSAMAQRLQDAEQHASDMEHERDHFVNCTFVPGTNDMESWEDRAKKLDQLLATERALALEQQWQPIETAPHEVEVLLFSPATQFGPAKMEVGFASAGWRRGGYSTMHWHGSATRWQPPPPTTPKAATMLAPKG